MGKTDAGAAAGFMGHFLAKLLLNYVYTRGQVVPVGGEIQHTKVA